VLCFSGHDPSGGAGIQADIETLNSHQCHACSVVTALTEQDSKNAYKIIPQSAKNIINQANRLLTDFSIKAIKIGLIGDHRIAIAISQLVSQYPDIPVILDPVLAAGGGMSVADDELIHAIRDHLLPNVTILTPNSMEARALAKQEELQGCGLTLLQHGCDYVLITGAHEESVKVSNKLFHNKQCMETYHWDRLPNHYHGSGCTLAASIAALCAHGLDINTVMIEAQEYTWNSLEAAYQPGSGQYNPQRLFWMHTD
jgi:hydroxymethylpyrimidine/phosphomethylpyrimidine kinase